MNYKYETERGLIIIALSEEIGELAQEIEKERECNGFTSQYRALSKTYNDATKHYLNLVKEVEAEGGDADELQKFTSVYDTKGLTVI